MTITNAGPPPTPEERAAHEAELEMRSKELPQWAYRVDRDQDPARPDAMTMFTWGTRVKASRPDGETPGEFAAYVGGIARAHHSYYTGRLHVWVWDLRPGDHYRDETPPAEAAGYTFAAGTPPIPPPEPCPHGLFEDCAVCDE